MSPANAIPVQIKKLDPDAVVPEYKKPGDAGFDLHALRRVEIPAGQAAIVPTGLAFAIPEGFEMQVRMRSGAALKTPLIVANAPGTIDAGYRGEVGIIVRNLGSEPYYVEQGERIAQGVVAPVCHADFALVDELPASERGTGGYGSTGSR